MCATRTLGDVVEQGFSQDAACGVVGAQKENIQSGHGFGRVKK
jgi:hypothetical protein